MISFIIFTLGLLFQTPILSSKGRTARHAGAGAAARRDGAAEAAGAGGHAPAAAAGQARALGQEVFAGVGVGGLGGGACAVVVVASGGGERRRQESGGDPEVGTGGEAEEGHRGGRGEEEICSTGKVGFLS